MKLAGLRAPTPHTLLIVVALGYGALVALHAFHAVTLTWDEVVYASQVVTGAEPADMSAPRAWGMPLLLAPVGFFTDAVPVIRAYLTVLAVAGLYLAFRPWLRIGPRYLAPVAAFLFCTLWTTVLFGAMAYPNVWLAFALTAGVGYFCRMAGGEAGVRPWAGAALAFALASLLRPTDSAAVAIPLLLAPLLPSVFGGRPARTPVWSRPAWTPPAAVAAGLGIGWGAWTVEAFWRFGGPVARLRAGAEVNEPGMGFSLLRHLEAVDGSYLLCRPIKNCADIHWFEVGWWLLLLPVAAAGLAVARTRGPYLLIFASTAAFTLPYLLLFTYANSRFLQPAYALLMLPVAGVLIAGIRRHRYAVVPIALVLAVHSYAQSLSFDRTLTRHVNNTLVQRTSADFLRDELGVAPRCALFGPGAIELAYLTGCRSAWTPTNPTVNEPRIRAARAAGERVVLLVRAVDRVPSEIPRWRLAKLPGKRDTYAYIIDR
ncbi:hypothetical protein [Rhizohabitans arisaemae]|uniref:hypothetical protein n=1 Tax=Rhizohabitans arisaemae TaxID=2720610 RepID=UPI0024B0487C|nr:hypothetical protein [Rhizohabitans arisaemae]